MFKSRLILSLVFLAYFTSESLAVVINATGEYWWSPDISELQCYEKAKQRAFNNAVAIISGETVQSETMKICEATSSDEIMKAKCELYQNSWSIIDAVIQKDVIKITNKERVDKGIYIDCKVSIEVDLEEKPKPDPNFDFSFELNKSKFTAGHEWSPEDTPLKITIQPYNNQKMYINIFHWMPYVEGKNVTRIFPRSINEGYNGFNLISYEVLLPYKSSGHTWRHVFPKDYINESVSEGILVFASKKDIHFADTFTYIDFQKKLLEVSDEETRSKKKMYVIIEE